MELIDFNRFVWRTDPAFPGRHIREAGGGEIIEDIWKLTKHGEQNLFLGVYVSSSTHTPPDALLLYVKRAWRSLRWELPTIASSTSHIWHEGKAPTAFITYDEAKSDEDVDKWVSETVEIYPSYGAESRSLDELRYDVGQDPIPGNDFDRQTFLYVVPYSETRFGLLLRTAHTTFDGSGVKILMTKLLGHLSSCISDPAAFESSHGKGKYAWGKEADRLLPMVTEILRQDEPEVKDEQGQVAKQATKAEPRDGPDYWSTLGEVMKDLVEGMPRSHKFTSFINPPFDPSISTPKTRRIEHRFTFEESQKIQESGRVGHNNLTEKLTVNHLVHGALSLLPLFNNPPPSDTDALIFYYGLVDGRQHLRKEYREPLAYPGYCLGMSALHIPASLFHQFSKDDKRGLVLAFAKEVKKEYIRQAAYPSLVAIQPQQGDLMLAASPPPPPWEGPAYAADGRGSVYLRPSYTPGGEGEPVLEVDDFFLGLNKCDPGPFFRCTEWKGRIILSADYNEFAVSEVVMKEWMEMWKDLVLAVMVK